MKRVYYLLLASVFVFSCQTTQESNTANEDDQNVTRQEKYPKILSDAFEKHGGLDLWQSFETLEYDVEKSEGPEHHVIDLKSRKVRISSDDYTIGFDGEDVWVSPDSSSFGGNARFYHNLYFYFYALPYLMADPGINYKDLGLVTVNGNEYHHILITFGDGIGDSPEDEYVLYFNKENTLELINYSVTYFDTSRAKNYNAIKYPDWTPVSGLLLPQKLIGYVWQEDSLGEKRYEREFLNPVLSKETKPSSTFEKPEGAFVSVR